jgi:hypothetical protein
MAEGYDEARSQCFEDMCSAFLWASQQSTSYQPSSKGDDQ